MDLNLSFIIGENDKEENTNETSTKTPEFSNVRDKAEQLHVENLKPVENVLGASGDKQEQANPLAIRQRAVSYAEEEAKRVYKTYQENIRKAAGLPSEILRGTRAGESPYTLLLKACKVIGLLTSDSTFYSSMENNIKAVYGVGLLEKVPLEIELEQVRGRLKKLSEAITISQRTDERERINDSITAHQRRVSELERLINNSNT